MTAATGTTSALLDALASTAVYPERLRAEVGKRLVVADGAGELEPRLAQVLYNELHTGLPERASGQPTLRTDPRLVAALERVVPFVDTPIDVVLVAVRRHELLVEWDGVRVAVPRRLAPAEHMPEPGRRITLRVSPARPSLSPGFLLVRGSGGGDLDAPPLRVYVDLPAPEVAVAAWGRVLAGLEATACAYQAKVLTCHGQYPRRDALVVYLPPDRIDVVEAVAQAVDGLVTDPVPVLAERVAPGVAVAWEPVDARFGLAGLSFGQHRTRVIARALIRSAVTGAERSSCLVEELAAAGVDPARPARNGGSDLP